MPVFELQQSATGQRNRIAGLFRANAHRHAKCNWQSGSVTHSISVPARSRPKTWEVRLTELSLLAPGWDSYDADPPQSEPLAAAKVFLACLRESSKEPATLNPTVVGGLGFTFRNGDRKAYIEFRNTGSLLMLLSDGVNPSSVKRYLKDIPAYRDIISSIETYLNADHT